LKIFNDVITRRCNVKEDIIII